MRRASGYKIAALVLTALAAPAASAAEPADDPVARGRHLAETLCASCHLNANQGEKSGPDGIPGFRAVARRPDQTVEGIMNWLRSVPPMMPNHRLTQDEMDVIAQFILSLAAEE